MKKLNLTPFVVLVLMLMSVGMSAQNSLWKKATSKEVKGLTTAERNSTPQEFTLFQLNTAALKSLLANAPERFTTVSDVVIDLPTKNGDLQSFRVYEASNFASELQEKHPAIRSYAAQGIDDPTAVARFSVSDIGASVMISSANYSTIYIDAFTTNKDYYMSYHTDQITDISGFQCLAEDNMGPELSMEDIDSMNQERNANDGKLRTFRLALASTRE